MLRRTPACILVVFLAGTLLTAPTAQAQTTWYVDDDAPNDPSPSDPTVSDPLEDGSAAHPFDAIQEGIDAASDGDTVLVLDGTYTGMGNKNLDYGGLDITVRSANGPDNCTIDCENSGRGFVFSSGETQASVVRGFRIRRGSASRGGAVYCYGSSPAIDDCEMTENRAFDHGGAVYVSGGGCSPVITNCRIIANSSFSRGGAVFSRNSSVTIDGCTLSGNHATYYGGAVWCYISNPTITNCTITGNSAWHGGGIHCESSSMVITNCVISGNLASGPYGTPWGGGVKFLSCDPILTNCTIAGNSADYAGSGMANFYGSSPTLTNCILWGNTAPVGDQICGGTPMVTYSDVQGGWAGVGNIDADPLFVDPYGPDDDPNTWEDNDYHLGVRSPCIDAGDNAAVPPDSTDLDGDGDTDEPMPFDLDGNPRFVDDPTTPGTGPAPPVDMGAYEFQDMRVPLDIMPGSCPNSLNVDSRDAIPMAIVGTAEFDVTQIDMESLMLRRIDGSGGSVTPPMGSPGSKLRVEDVATPFEGEPCECHDRKGDGIDDLLMKLDPEILVTELQLEGLPGNTWMARVELVVTGELSDGTRFSATDCIDFVPPEPGPEPTQTAPDTGDEQRDARSKGQPPMAQEGLSASDSSRQDAERDELALPPISEPDDADAGEDQDVRDASVAPIVGCGPISPALLFAAVAATRLLRRS